MELIKFLHKEVIIILKTGETVEGFVENMDNDFDTDSGEDEITISQDGKNHELAIKESEIDTINVK